MSRVSHLLSIAKSLPASPIRAPGTPQLSDAFEKIITRTFPSIGSSSPAATTPGTSDPTKTIGSSEERVMESMISGIERIKSNDALQRYQLGNTTMRPIHDPLYYKRIVDGVHRAQKGQGRSWWRRFFQVKGEA